MTEKLEKQTSVKILQIGLLFKLLLKLPQPLFIIVALVLSLAGSYFISTFLFGLVLFVYKFTISEDVFPLAGLIPYLILLFLILIPLVFIFFVRTRKKLTDVK